MLASVMDSRLENLSLSVDEKEELVLNTGEDGSTTQSFDLCLIGRFLTDRMINFNAMKHRLASVWRLGKVGSMSLNVSKQLGNFIGKFVDYDINNNAGLWRNFMRIKVLLDVRQPLKRWKKIRKPQGEWPLVHFKYERLSTFCYLCTMLGHSEKFCDKIFFITDGDIKREWSSNLRVPVRRGSEYGGERWLRETMENSTHADDSGLPQILHGLQTFPTCTTKPSGSSHADGHVITSGVAANRVLETSSTTNISLSGPGAFCVDRVKRGGGLAFLWRKAWMFSLLSYSQSHIDMEVLEEDGFRWRVTGFYGFLNRSQRHLSWNLLRFLYSASSLPWCCLGDFNDIVYLHLKGYPFTWERGRGSSHWVEERLDWALVNVSWLNLFSDAKLNNLVAPVSDHSPIELNTVDKFSCVYKHRFQFENGWLKEDGLDFVVSNAWRSPHAESLIDKIYTCSFALKEWGREHAFKFKNKISITKVQQMHPDKSPGPDGFNPAFFQHFWPLIGNDIFHACSSWLNNNEFPASLNETIIVLIPKNDNLVSMRDLRPIALCNVLYKIIAKVLANRLKVFFPVLIDESQSAFVPGRAITNNVVVAFELIHYMKRKTHGKVRDVALKIDINKAYDRIRWDYLKASMLRMSFDFKWVEWIMLCVSTVFYSVFVNGELVGPFSPGRGICRGAPRISHLLFVDDSFFFFRADVVESSTMHTIFAKYESDSGQAINFQKSGIFFSRNASSLDRDFISNILGVSTPLNTRRYLGLLSLIGKSKRAVFGFLRDRLWRHLQGWQSKLLSQAELQKMMNSFWWGLKSNGGRRINWLSWDKLCLRKEEGGLGFRNLRDFNLAMLGKQGWNLITKPDSLIARLFKARYYCSRDFLSARLSHNPSFTWKGIWSSQAILLKGSRWRIGDGCSIDVWNNPWLRDTENFKVETPIIHDLAHLKVHDLWIHGSWNMLWDLSIPPKIKLCLWRACKGCLPTRSALCARVSASLSFLKDWLDARLGSDQKLSNGNANTQVKWSKPSPGMLKCNVDAVIFSEHQTIGLGVILRNEFGSVVGCYSKVVNGVSSPKKAEALGLREAARWLLELRVSNVIVELDAKGVYDSFYSKALDRQANAAADALAKAASSFASPSFWRDAPPLLGAILASDVSISSH
ncbi:Transposon TX1 uncharacterized 149 kDa protein [Vitis vinifera]|uniref:Transposon TX1 uncharacterized 149 kDa protein n=1 Tax=Vitis vinifera TaxID=29760 RepID=A0A438D8U2_VITVI|nr:Transposon TX1 uncharacterized 149 kDa protein [Vitis vinifera]